MIALDYKKEVADQEKNLLITLLDMAGECDDGGMSAEGLMREVKRRTFKVLDAVEEKLKASMSACE